MKAWEVAERYRGFAGAGDPSDKLVVGPLATADVDAVAREAGRVPTLVLNRPSPGSGARPEKLFAFGLFWDDDVKEMVRFAREARRLKAALVFPQTQWGGSYLQAFRQRLPEQLALTLDYDSTGTLRRRELDALDSKDVQVVFLVARHEDAARLFEQLSAAVPQIPVIGIRDLHAGNDKAANRQLAGLYFVDIPWMLEADTQDDLKNDPGWVVRLYALGMDAFALAPRLDDPNAGSELLNGKTGQLTIDRGNGVIRRTMTLARYGADGKARAVGVDVLRRAQVKRSEGAQSKSDATPTTGAKGSPFLTTMTTGV